MSFDEIVRAEWDRIVSETKEPSNNCPLATERWVALLGERGWIEVFGDPSPREILAWFLEKRREIARSPWDDGPWSFVLSPPRQASQSGSPGTP